MAKQGQKKKVRESGLKKGAASPGALAAEAEFLHRIERSRKNYKPDSTPLHPLREKLVEQIELAFAGVQCLNEPCVLLCGEAMDEYRARYADELTPREYGALLMQRYAGRMELKK